MIQITEYLSMKVYGIGVWLSVYLDLTQENLN